MCIPYPALSPFPISLRFIPALIVQGLRVVRLHSSRPPEAGRRRVICRHVQLQRRKTCGGASGGSRQNAKLDDRLGRWIVEPREKA